MICVICGEFFYLTPGKSGRKPKMCSNKCRQRNKQARVDPKKAVTRARAWREKNRENSRIVSACIFCGKFFSPLHGGVKLCSDECRLLNKRAYNAKHEKIRNRINDEKSRLRRRQWRMRNKDRARLQGRIWMKSNPDKIRERVSRAYTKKVAVVTALTELGLIEKAPIKSAF